MNIDPELLACVRSEYDRLRDDLRHIEKGEWGGLPSGEVQLVRSRMRRLAMLVVLNDDWAEPKPH